MHVAAATAVPPVTCCGSSTSKKRTIRCAGANGQERCERQVSGQRLAQIDRGGGRRQPQGGSHLTEARISTVPFPVRLDKGPHLRLPALRCRHLSGRPCRCRRGTLVGHVASEREQRERKPIQRRREQQRNEGASLAGRAPPLRTESRASPTCPALGGRARRPAARSRSLASDRRKSVLHSSTQPARRRKSVAGAVSAESPPHPKTCKIAPQGLLRGSLCGLSGAGRVAPPCPTSGGTPRKRRPTLESRRNRLRRDALATQ